LTLQRGLGKGRTAEGSYLPWEPTQVGRLNRLLDDRADHIASELAQVSPPAPARPRCI
jgi:hypothetical protein